MNTKNWITAILVICSVLAITTLIFLAMLSKEGAVLHPPAPKGPKIIEEPAGYNIPQNPVPPVHEIEEGIKNTEEKRADLKDLSDEIRETKMKRKIETQIHIPQESEAPQAAPTGQKIKEGADVLPAKKEVIFPASEENERLKSQGIITH